MTRLLHFQQSFCRLGKLGSSATCKWLMLLKYVYKNTRLLDLLVRTIAGHGFTGLMLELLARLRPLVNFEPCFYPTCFITYSSSLFLSRDGYSMPRQTIKGLWRQYRTYQRCALNIPYSDVYILYTILFHSLISVWKECKHNGVLTPHCLFTILNVHVWKEY